MNQPSFPSVSQIGMSRALWSCGVIVAWLCLASSEDVRAMESDRHAWLNVTGIGRLGNFQSGNSPWRYWVEAQTRFNDDVSRRFQTIARPAIGYDLSNRLTVWAGSAWIETEGSAGTRSEHRPWQQLTWFPEAGVGGFSLQLRPRLEQRMLQGSEKTGWRFRQFVRGTSPLGGSVWSLILQDEIFFNLNDTDYGARGGFDQNRAFVGVGYQATRIARLEAGYLNMFMRTPHRPDTMNHVLSVNLFLIQ
jgi:hypothetical protein